MGSQSEVLLDHVLSWIKAVLIQLCCRKGGNIEGIVANISRGLKNKAQDDARGLKCMNTNYKSSVRRQ